MTLLYCLIDCEIESQVDLLDEKFNNLGQSR